MRMGQVAPGGNQARPRLLPDPDFQRIRQLLEYFLFLEKGNAHVGQVTNLLLIKVTGYRDYDP